MFIVFFVQVVTETVAVYCVCLKKTAASQSHGRRRRVLEKIRAKRETNIKTEDHENDEKLSIEDSASGNSCSGRQTNACGAASPADAKSLLAECVILVLQLNLRKVTVS